MSQPFSLRLDEELANGEMSTLFQKKDSFLSSLSPTMPTNGQKKKDSTPSISAKLFYPLFNCRKQLRSNVKENIHFKAWRMKQ